MANDTGNDKEASLETSGSDINLTIRYFIWFKFTNVLKIKDNLTY